MEIIDINFMIFQEELNYYELLKIKNQKNYEMKTSV